MSTPADSTTEERVLEYAREFIRGYTEAIDSNFAAVKTFLDEVGLSRDYFQLYGRQVGADVAIAAFISPADFYMFFLDERGAEIKACADTHTINLSEFSQEWTFGTPHDQRVQKVKDYLGLGEARLFSVGPFSDVLSISGANVLAPYNMPLEQQGRQHGVGAGNEVGEWAKGELPVIQEQLKTASTRTRILTRYRQLTQSDMKPTVRGQQFEKLWRDVLDHYGWRPKKIRIPGEDNDFTAIYQGLHILGEVRWFKTPMTGAKMREFLAKLDPRPQTIGMFVSLSGVDAGGMAVVRRAVNTKTVVIFDQADIENVILESADPGPIFEEKLRDAYDYIFETSENS